MTKQLTVGGFIPPQLEKDFVSDRSFLSPRAYGKSLDIGKELAKTKGTVSLEFSISSIDFTDSINSLIKSMQLFMLHCRGYTVVNKRGRNKLRSLK